MTWVERLARAMERVVPDAITTSILLLIISTLVALFIPTSGGQWLIQGLVTVETAALIGVSPQRGLLALIAFTFLPVSRLVQVRRVRPGAVGGNAKRAMITACRSSNIAARGADRNSSCSC